MKSGLRGLLAVLAAVILLVAVLVAVRFVDFSRYRDRITEPLSEIVGRQVRIDGPIRIEPGLSTRLVADRVSFANAEWGSRPEMVTAKRVAATVAILPLLRGQIDIGAIVIDGMDLLIEKDDEGLGNWQLGQGEMGGDTDDRPPRGLPRLRRVELRDAHLTYSDAAAGQPRSLDLERLELRSPDPDSPLEIALEADFHGAHVVANGSSSPVTTWIIGDTFPTFDGSIELSANDPAAAAAGLGAKLRTLPAAALSARVGTSKGALSVRDIDARVGASDLKGEVSLSWTGERPRIKGGLRSDVLDLSELLPRDAGKSSKGRKGRATDSESVFWRSLTLANADISVAIGSLRLRTGGAVDDITLTAKLEDGALDISSGSARIGTARSEGRLQADDEAKRVALELHATGVPMEKLFGGDTVRQAMAAVDVRLSGHGGSRSAIVHTLAGTALLDVGSGTFTGPFLDLIAGDVLGQLIDLIDPTARKSGPTRLDCAVVNAKVRNGVVEFDKGLAMETENLRIIGAGTVDLRTEEIDLAFRSDPKGGVGVGVSTVVDSLIRIRGTLTKPRVRIDPLGTVGVPTRVGGAVVRGGLSLLGRALLDKSAAPRSWCLIAKGMAPAEKSTAGGVAGTVESVGKAIGKGASGAGRSLRKLFGGD
jgi:uncharacterized protein involved in outer membrane biogenesis